MKGYTIRESIDRLEKRGGGSGGGSSASDISFNKTGTSLNATNVQTAIAEVDANVSANVADIEQAQLDIVALERSIGVADSDTPIPAGYYGEHELYKVRFATTGAHAQYQSIGTLPENAVVVSMSGLIHGAYGGQSIVGIIGLSFGSGWENSVQILGNSVQVQHGGQVTALEVDVTYYVVEPEPSEE